MSEGADFRVRFELSTTGAAKNVRFANRFNRAQREAQNRIFVAINNAGHAGVAALKRHAPVSRITHERFHKPGTLKGAIGVLSDARSGRSARRPSIVIGVDEEKAVSPRPFPYTEVTRRGRRAFTVKMARRPDAHSRDTAKQFASGFPSRRRDGSEARALGRSAALAFPNKAGQLIYRRSVGPYRPTGDWVTRADPEVKAETQKELDLAARDISRFLRTGFSRAARLRRV